MAVSEAEFMQLSAEEQIKALKEEHAKLEQDVAAIQNQSGGSIMQKVSTFIKILLAFTINAFTSIEAIVAGMKMQDKKLADQDGKVQVLTRPADQRSDAALQQGRSMPPGTPSSARRSGDFLRRRANGAGWLVGSPARTSRARARRRVRSSSSG